MERDFQHIIDEHYGILFKIGRAYTQEEADFEDLYQEMLIQLWKSYSRFRGQAKLSTYIYRVALNTALTHQRKQRKQSQLLSLNEGSRQIVDNSHSELIKVQQKEQQTQLLYSCIYALKKEDRALILLHLEGKSYDEMAEIMGITITNIGVRLLRCKKRLQKLLIANGYARV